MKSLHYVITTILACTSFALGLHLTDGGYLRDICFFYSGGTFTIVGMFLYADWETS
jgi:hypothetical protein